MKHNIFEDNSIKMRKPIILFAILIISSLSWSQNNEIENDYESNSVLLNRVNCIFIEGGGKGILGSVNYEHILPFSPNHALSLGVSAGFLLDFAGNVTYVVGKGNHFAEIGVGYSLPGYLLISNISYRYQANSGFLFKAGPMYFASTQPESFGDFFWGGISFGYSFPKTGLSPVK